MEDCVEARRVGSGVERFVIDLHSRAAAAAREEEEQKDSLVRVSEKVYNK